MLNYFAKVPHKHGLHAENKPNSTNLTQGGVKMGRIFLDPKLCLKIRKI